MLKQCYEGLFMLSRVWVSHILHCIIYAIKLFSVQKPSVVILCLSQILQINRKDMRTLFTLPNHSEFIHDLDLQYKP